MDQGQSSTGIELPMPGSVPTMSVGERAPLRPESGPASVTPERLPQVGNVPGSAPMQPIAQQPASPLLQAAPPPMPPPAAPAIPIVALPVTAEDNDLIEKEWVLKAKEIVERTRSDPYLQNKEISRVKAAYIKKRWNRDTTVAGN